MNFIKSLKTGVLATLGLSTIAAADSNFTINKINEINATKPAFLFNYVNQTTGYHDLFISSFGPFRSGSIYKINEINGQMTNSEVNIEQAVTDLKWPNEISEVPSDIFGANTYAVADGFLVPGKGTGSVTIFNTENNISFKVTKDKSGFFYHRVIWHDMNGDGLLDLITARGKKPMIGRAQGELVWLEQPTGNKTEAWKEHLIAKGPDVHFRIRDLNGDGQIEIVASEFFHKKLTLIEFKDGEWQRHIIDDTLGSAFDLDFDDINNDGKIDLLVTNHEGDKNAAVFGYEIPEDIYSNWTRHTLFSGFVTKQRGVGQASPGEAMAVHPDLNNKDSKPVILVSGDGSQHAHILTPVSEDPNNWEYTEKAFLNAGCTVGKMAVNDVNNDGLLEIFVPAYDNDKIHVFSFSK
jgi:hypothetical protein